MDHIQNLKLAVKQWWSNKYLWIFGIIVTFFTNSNSSNFENNNDNGESISTLSEEGMEKLTNGFDAFTNQTEPVMLAILIGIGVIIGLLFIAGAIYLAGKAKTALIMEGTQILKNGSPKGNFQAAWNATGNQWINLFVMNVISTLIIILPIIALLVILFVVIFSSEGTNDAFMSLGVVFMCMLVCVVIIPLIILGISITVIKEIAAREIVLNGKGGIDALKIGYYNFKSIWKEYVLGLIVFLIPSTAYTFILFIVLVPAAIFSGLLIMLTETMEGNQLMILSIYVTIQLFIMLFSAILGGPLTSLHAQYWNILYDKLKHSKAKDKTEEEVVVA
jgi:hypothetical protein